MMLRGIVLIALSAAELPPEDQPAVGSATDSAAAVRHAFADFLEQFDKVYAEEEVPQRFKTFDENYRRVLEHNTMASPYTQSINEFADLTEEEFAAKHLGFNGSGTAFEGWPHLGDHLESAVDASSLDWRNRGAVTPVKNQGQCGACWTFLATGGLEGAGKLTTGDLVSLSEQEILDCSESQGCGGGNMAIAFSFAKTHTITVEENYPYTAQEGTCKQESWTCGLWDGTPNSRDVGSFGRCGRWTVGFGVALLLSVTAGLSVLVPVPFVLCWASVFSLLGAAGFHRALWLGGLSVRM